MVGLILLLQEPQSAARAAWPLWGDYSLADPEFLGFLPFVLACFWWGRRRAARAQGGVPLLPVRPRPSLRQRLTPLVALVHLIGIGLVVVAMARPLRGSFEQDVVAEGIDILLAVDQSGSMRFDDLEPGKSRLDVVKEVVGDFAQRRMTDREGAADNCALISFARYPKLHCPFTLDVGAILGMLDGVSLVKQREQDGTAIGVALAKAVAVLEKTRAKSKVCVLLTDGENNVEDIQPLEAAELAAEQGVRVYTIYAARYVYRHDPFRGYQPMEMAFDTSELEGIAELTGGRFYHARDRAALEDIYAEIEKLERTEREEKRYEQQFDLYPWFLLPGLFLYSLAWLSNSTLTRRIA